MACASSRRKVLEVFENDNISHPWNCGAASVEQVYRHYLCKEGSDGLVMLQGVLTANCSRTYFYSIKADLEPVSGPQVFGYARWRKDTVKISSEFAQEHRVWSASV